VQSVANEIRLVTLNSALWTSISPSYHFEDSADGCTSFKLPSHGDNPRCTIRSYTAQTFESSLSAGRMTFRCSVLSLPGDFFPNHSSQSYRAMPTCRNRLLAMSIRNRTRQATSCTYVSSTGLRCTATATK
jgi:hypothetical protein